MFQNYVTTALRNLYRNKLFSVINIGGLAISLAACILIFLFVRHETSYDDWIPQSDRTYRVFMDFLDLASGPLAVSGTPGTVKEGLEQYFPNEIDKAARIYLDGATILYGEKKFAENTISADREFFEIFELPVVAGNLNRALADNNSVAISESIARKYFGDEPPIGKVIRLKGSYLDDNFKVAAVFRDLPDATHFVFDAVNLLVPERYDNASWILKQWFSNSDLYTYFTTRPGVDVAALEARFADMLDSYASNVDADTKAHDIIRFSALPVNEINLYSRWGFDMKATGKAATVYAFSAIAFLILLIAATNYINLATARSFQRAREIGIRKVLGANRKVIFRQFMGESFIITFLAFILAFAVAEISVPMFNQAFSFNLASVTLADADILVFSAGLLLFVGLASGFYPSMVLSRFKPVKILGSRNVGSGARFHPRNLLVFIQFVISIALIVATAVVFIQHQFATTMDPGYSTENNVIVSGFASNEPWKAAEAFKQEVKNLSGVRSAAYSQNSLPTGSHLSADLRSSNMPPEETVRVSSLQIDEDFFDVHGILPLSGRTFSPQYGTDSIPLPKHGADPQTVSGAAVLSQGAVQRLGFEDALAATGETVIWQIAGHTVNMEIVGVIPDLHMHSLREARPPVLFYMGDRKPPYMAMTLSLDARAPKAETVAAIEGVWNGMFPDIPFSFAYTNDNIAALYADEGEAGQILVLFSALALLVSALGLFGISSFTVERRAREIGIRKVMGASVSQIARLLIGQFSIPVVIANLIAWPLSWYFLNGWLNGFAYRIDLNVGFFAGAGLLALLIATATVGGHTWFAARANPVHALRDE